MLFIIIPLWLASILLTRQYYIQKIKKFTICDFNNACTKFDSSNTAEVAKRIVNLIFQEEIKQDELKKILKTEISKVIRDL